MDANTADPDAVRGLLTIKQFTREYGIGRTKTFELLAQGRLRAVKSGARTLIPRREAEQFAQALPERPSRRPAA